MAEETNIQPENIDQLSPTGYKLQFEKIKDAAYFCQRLTLPGVTSSEIIVNTPFSAVKVPSETIRFDPLQIEFKVDEDLSNWLEIYDWMKGLTFPQSFQQFRDLRREKPAEYSDASIIIFNNSNLSNFKVTLHRCFPISLSGIPFNATETDISPILCEATFGFTTYTISRINQ